MTSVFAFWISLILVAGTCDHSETIVAAAKVPPLRYRVARTHTHVYDQSVCGWNDEAVLFLQLLELGSDPGSFSLFITLVHSDSAILLRICFTLKSSQVWDSAGSAAHITNSKTRPNTRLSMMMLLGRGTNNPVNKLHKLR